MSIRNVHIRGFIVKKAVASLRLFITETYFKRKSQVFRNTPCL